MSCKRVLLSISLALAACGSEGGEANPAPVASMPDAGVANDAVADVTGDVNGDVTPDVQLDAGPPIAPRRTIVQRNPFGNYAETDNLLYDGDFEWAGAMATQYPWLAWPSFGSASAPAIERGPRCRSGMSCARIQPGAGAAGIGMNPAQGHSLVTISLWIRPAQADECPNINVSLEGCFQNTESQALPKTDEPLDADGWCRRSGVLTVPNDTPCLFVSVEGTPLNAVLIDDVVMKPAPAGAKLQRVMEYSKSHQQIVARLRESARKLRRAVPMPTTPLPLKGKIR